MFGVEGRVDQGKVHVVETFTRFINVNIDVTISFGLVSIPVSLYPATRREELKFRLLRASDLSPVNYKRVAEADGKEVPWDKIVKGYEYEKDKYVVLKDEDFARVDVEATQTVEIIQFVRRWRRNRRHE